MTGAYLSAKLKKRFDAITDDKKRSKEVINFYMSSIAKFDGFSDPTDVAIDNVDGPGDGGLDAYIISARDKKIVLFQSKWYTTPFKLSKGDSQDLLNFYNIYLMPGKTTGLNPEVMGFVNRWTTHLKSEKYCIEMVYVTNASFDPLVIAEYNKLDIKFKIVGEEALGEEYYHVLSEEELFCNEMIFSIPGNKSLKYQARFLDGSTPIDVPVVQCAVRGIDLKRAYVDFEESIFVRNLRLGLGTKTNKGIAQSAVSPDQRGGFYVLHNGISIICEEFDLLDQKGIEQKVTDGEISTECDDKAYLNECTIKGIDSFIWMKNFQIVNGAQTTITLSGVEDKYLEDVILPCKISKTLVLEIAQKIAVDNNTQNKITPWDLVANSPALTCMQNYASTLAPPIFVKRRSGEKWSQARFSITAKPANCRMTRAIEVFQSYLSFKGHPGPAYSRPSAVLEPNEIVYSQIASMPDLDLLLATALIANYEDEARGKSPKSPFEKVWKQWAVALAGHYYFNLIPADQESFKEKILSSGGLGTWKILRNYFVGMMDEFITCFPAGSEVQKIFKENADLWDSATSPSLIPKDIFAFINPKVKDSTFHDMREKYRGEDLLIEYYDVTFAILAAFMDKYEKTHPIPAI